MGGERRPDPRLDLPREYLRELDTDGARLIVTGLPGEERVIVGLCGVDGEQIVPRLTVPQARRLARALDRFVGDAARRARRRAERKP